MYFIGYIAFDEKCAILVIFPALMNSPVHCKSMPGGMVCVTQKMANSPYSVPFHTALLLEGRGEILDQVITLGLIITWSKGEM